MLSQSEVKYNRLIEKAGELFLKFGYKSVSMDQIAEVVGISKMTIYRYFPSKEELFIESVLCFFDKIFIDIKSRLKTMDSTLEKVDFLLNHSIEHSKQYSMDFVKDIVDSPYILGRIKEKKINMTREIFQDIIKEGMKKGEIRKVDEDFLGDMLILLIEGIHNSYIDNIKSLEEAYDFTEKFYDFLKYGLLGGKNE